MKHRLTYQKRLFVEEYLQCWSITRAAERAGYKWPTRKGWALLQEPPVKALIEKRLSEKVMETNEVLARLAEQARGDISDFIKPGGAIDWDKVHEKGYLIKRISHQPGRHSTIELYDAQAALVNVGRHLKLFTDRVEIDDWREQAREDGVDPERLENELVKQFAAAMVSSGGDRSIPDCPPDSAGKESG